MTNEEKISLIEDALEIEPSTLKPETLVGNISELDSMGKLTLIVLCDDEFNKKLTGEKLKEFNTVQDILDFMA
ncbi:MAG: acyl carrier protein [Prolixibacteraceae bacterium]|jgi:acyl carrier protein|nr:acyl carrier protein [Prolixibacteraceae bacterium]